MLFLRGGGEAKELEKDVFQVLNFDYVAKLYFLI